MKSFIVLCLVAVAMAAPPFDGEVLRYENDNIGTGGYRYVVEQSDGTQQEAVAELTNDQGLAVKGSYTWQADDGFRYTVTYVADSLGYRSTIDKQGVSNGKYSA